MIWDRITIICPENLVSDANAFAVVVGASLDDGQTFGPPAWEDSSGNRYSVASSQVPEGFLSQAASALTAPSHAPDADMAAAARAQSLIYVHGVHGFAGADTGRLWISQDAEPRNAIEIAGLSPLPGGP